MTERVQKGNWSYGPRRQETKTKGKDCMVVMDHAQIANIYAGDKTPTHACIVADFRPPKSDPNRVHITEEDNMIKCPVNLTTRTIDITTTKIV